MDITNEVPVKRQTTVVKTGIWRETCHSGETEKAASKSTPASDFEPSVKTDVQAS